MTIDPGLSNDSCIFMETVPGDQGAHAGNSVWWLSPDVGLTGPVSGADTADSGQVNQLTANFHRKLSSSNCNFPGDESITVEIWVANPSLVIAPRVRGSAARVAFVGAPLPAEGASGTEQVDWTPAPGLPPKDPQCAGPKCLVARCYPDSGIPSGASFFLPGDQHVVQRNLCLVSASGHGVIFKVNTVNPGSPLSLLQPPSVKLTAVLDLLPNHFVKKTVLDRLQGVSGFQQLRTAALSGGFKFDLTGFNVSQVVDHSHPGLTPLPPATLPSYEAKVSLPAGVLVQIPFAVNLAGVNAGDACVFHLTQTSSAGAPEGGLTLIVLRS